MNISIFFKKISQFTKKSKSTKWFKEHIKDTYVKKAQKENYRSRAAFKLLEINKKYKIIKKGDKVIDLGSSPGGWSQVAAQLVQPTPTEEKRVVSVDILPMKHINGCQFIQLDILDKQSGQLIQQQLQQQQAQCLLSDMAPNLSDDIHSNYINIAGLNLMTIQTAFQQLQQGGQVALKTLQGPTEPLFYALYKPLFNTFYRFKPFSSKPASTELYYVGKGFLNQFNNIHNINRLSIQFYHKVSIDQIQRLNMKQKQTIIEFWNNLLEIKLK